MKERTETVVRYECETCGTRYRNREEAELCEEEPIEEQQFEVGDEVRAIEPRQCWNGEEYTATGHVLSVQGPKCSDVEYEIKWLGGKRERLESHVFLYEIAYDCPICGNRKTAIYYAPELTKVQ